MTVGEKIMRRIFTKLTFGLLALGTSSSIYGAIIIGGQDNIFTDSYTALVSEAGVTTALSGPGVLLSDGIIDSVAVNVSEAGIIGGRDDTTGGAYAALFSSSGFTTLLTGTPILPAAGRIKSVSVNNSGLAVIGGEDSDSREPYMALVSSGGVLSALSGAIPSGTGSINSVAINDAGASIIGGNDNSSDAYAAVVSSGGVAIEISGAGIPSGSGRINSVAINNSGAAIIGGLDGGSSDPYAAVISSAGVATEISGAAAPSGTGSILSVDISDNGTSIVGGTDAGSAAPYVALVSSSGVTTALTGDALPPATGSINAVAINSTGEAIIGGTSDLAVSYAALVSSTGVTTALTGDALPPASGQIDTVAINDLGAAVIGGVDSGASLLYAALVSPSGVTTALSGASLPSGEGEMRSVAISDSSAILDAVVPTSFGTGSGFANSLFALTSQVASSQYSYQHKASYNRANNGPNFDQEVGLLADATDTIRWNKPCTEDAKYSIWAIGFGDYVRQKKSGNFSKATSWIGGAMVGFDFRGFENGVIGLGAAYAYNYTDLAGNAGNAKTHQEFLTVYGSWNRKYLFINAALWGGLYQSRNTRRTMGMTSRANVDGWLLSPHLEISTPFYGKEPWFVIEPFVMFDWANNWQDSFKESGASGFNIVVGNQYSSLLRSEAGLRFYQSLGYTWGSVILQEKGSWVNKKPFSTNRANVFFVGSASTFGIEVFSNKTQNLGAVQFNAQFIPCKKKYPYGSLNYQGEFGSIFQSHLISAEIGKNF